MYILNIGWERFAFDNAADAAQIADLLDKVRNIDSLYVNDKLVWYIKEGTREIRREALSLADILPNYDAALQLQTKAQAVAPVIDDKEPNDA